ncbi:indole-3-glycerol phosphate synthase TrpC [Marininema halotolerans]|uniref:Indole-3-glycerol phosphate synthase n=1 Tax=Marininema halotolerans TaxID=1155944 RepID=A0A1I6TZD8_9BACL|nr:indole-3-glycerol phosphate synthase TrpC [Marininema halotolerans]SFS94556.1 indole-3-glycerol phosphate synthase [Marininema halotolerans]
MFLETIIDVKRQEIVELEKRLSGKEIEPKNEELPSCRSLATAMTNKGNPPALIAEVKPASPSKGVIREKVDPVATAMAYEKGGASAVSVLTDRSFFKADPENLRKVKPVVGIPVLRKDFIIDRLQVVESRYLGADAILLIAAILSEEACCFLTEEAHRLGMEVLLEVHDETELPRALKAKPDLLGINNRNLSTFTTDLAVTERIRPLIPGTIPVIGESGIHSQADYQRLAAAGVDGVLVGEYLMKQSSPEIGVRNLLMGGVF